MLSILKYKYLTIDDIKLKGKKVLLRVDFNSPIKNDIVVNNSFRIRSHIETINNLNGNKIILITHQGKPGKKNFINTYSHAKLLSKYLNKDIKYVDDIFGSLAKKTIKSMDINDIILLENVRFYSEEMIVNNIQCQEKTFLVKNLSPLIDVYVNDAFSVSHRSHVSVTGFSRIKPSLAGTLMKKDIENIQKIMEKNGQFVFSLGGSKVEDTINIIIKLIHKNKNSIFLLSGILGNIALKASNSNIRGINNISKYYKYIKIMKYLLEKYPKNIYYPLDLALNDNGNRKEIFIEELNKFNLNIGDIGTETINQYSNIIKNSDVSILNGPTGTIEEKSFDIGTKSIIKASSFSKNSLISGGDISNIIDCMDTIKKDNFSYISSGGKACLYYLSESNLPGIKALEYFYNKKII